MASDVTGGATHTSCAVIQILYSLILENSLNSLMNLDLDSLQLHPPRETGLKEFCVWHCFNRHRLSLQAMFICNRWDGQCLFSKVVFYSLQPVTVS